MGCIGVPEAETCFGRAPKVLSSMVVETKKRRILALAEGRFSPLKSKTANGAIAYLPGEVVGVIDSTKSGLTAQQVLGYGGAIPVIRSLEEGLRAQSEPPLQLSL